MRVRRMIAGLLAGTLCASLLGGCSGGVGTKYKDKAVGFQLEMPAVGERIAILHTNKGDISLRLFPEAAPKAVENFIALAESRYYEGVTFHRVIDDFMIQTGDPTGTGSGGESFDGEPFEDEFDEKLLNLRGAVAMANRGVDTNTSQFFINQSPADEFPGRDYYTRTRYENEYFYLLQSQGQSFATQYPDIDTYIEQYYGGMNPDPEKVPDEVWELYGKTGGNISLDGAWRQDGKGHTVFAQVFAGMEVVDAIAAVETDDDDKPVEDVVITRVEITTYAG